MIQFQCGQCGQRIAIHKRNLGTAVVCPDCGGTTNPIAEQIIKRRAAAARRIVVRAPAPLHVCANCNECIGRLQKLHLWENRNVCAACHRRLSEEQRPASSAVSTVAVRRVPRQEAPERTQSPVDHLMPAMIRPFRGGLFGALVGLSVAGAALYGALTLLQSVAGLITGLAIGGLALLMIYLGLRFVIASRRSGAIGRQTRELQVVERRR